MARGDTHRLIRWLWTSRRLDARLVRLGLLPVSAGWRLASEVRTLAYERGWARRRELPLPSVAVGNLTVGGSGKTPIASWIAAYYVGIGYQARDPPARAIAAGTRSWCTVASCPRRSWSAIPIVPPGPRTALARGRPGARARRCLPAARRLARPQHRRGERRDDARRPVVAPGRTMARRTARARSRRCADRHPQAGRRRRRRWDSRAISRRGSGGPSRCVSLGVRRYEGMLSGRRVGRGRPGRASGWSPRRRLVTRRRSSRRPRRPARRCRWPPGTITTAIATRTWRGWPAPRARPTIVVITQKDAVKLRDRWPASVPEPLVAALDLTWEEGHDALVGALHAVVMRLE